MRIVVIGNGMVGFHFCETFRELSQEHEVVIFGEEPGPAYKRVYLTNAFTNDNIDSLNIEPIEWYSQNSIQLNSNELVVAIDSINKTVTTNLNSSIQYDKLVLATGSNPFIPKVPGIQLTNIFAYRTLVDVQNITSAALNKQFGVVVGGGLLGLEAAKALLDLGIKNVTVLEHGFRIMQRQLDDTAASLLSKSIQALGVNVIVNAQIQEFLESNQAVEGISLNDGRIVRADLVVISAGIRPRDDLAKSANIEIGERGGFVVDSWMRSSNHDIYAIGECALHKGVAYGLVAPGYQMAETCAASILGNRKPFLGYDSSTELKLLGIDVASIGNPFESGDKVEDSILMNLSRGIYKKILFDKESRKLIGAILVGDKNEYSVLNRYLKTGDALPNKVETLFVDSNDLQEDACATAGKDDNIPVCNCKGVTRGDIRKAIANGCEDILSIKKSTKAGTGCGSCLVDIDKLLKNELRLKGVATNNNLCEHFAYTRAGLYQVIKASKINDFDTLIERYGKGNGCEICKTTVGNLLASIFNQPILENRRNTLQDSNDRFLANIQKNGTYSVVPRVPAGEITPKQLMVIAQVALEFDLYTKITGGQRIDLFGAKLDDLPKIWQILIDAGFESGHAYAKSVRTVKSCVGSSWCRFGVQDSVGMALILEKRYKGIRSPHKIKMGVSGCARECAEAQGKDVGVIASENGYSLYVCGNGGAKPRHADLLAVDLNEDELVKIIDRFLMYYIRTADRLQRTSSWLDELPGGLESLKSVVLSDTLGICKELEDEMEVLAQGFQCEWKSALENPATLHKFKSFQNTDVPDPTIQFTRVRDQISPIQLTTV